MGEKVMEVNLLYEFQENKKLFVTTVIIH